MSDPSQNPGNWLFIDAVIHARPEHIERADPFTDNPEAALPLSVHPRQLDVPFAVSFEQSMWQMDRLPRMLVEPDGSFVWTGQEDLLAWQLDGNLFDRNGRLLYVVVRGRCPDDRWSELLNCFGWPESAILIQSVAAAVYLEEPVYRKLAGRPTNQGND